MQVHISENPTLTETEVTISCRVLNEDVLKLAALLRASDAKLTGEREGQTYLMNAAEVLYADTVDRHTFFYTRGGIYETPLRLYELEERLAPHGFVRTGKSSLVNFSCVRSLRPDFGGRFLLTLENEEQISVSRQYVPAIKSLLGL